MADFLDFNVYCFNCLIEVLFYQFPKPTNFGSKLIFFIIFLDIFSFITDLKKYIAGNQ